MEFNLPLVAVCGKFQPFHREHLDYVLAAFSIATHVIVGITNPDPGYIRYSAADPVRGRPESNPATYYERHLMVIGSLRDAGVSDRRFEVVPFPLNVPESWFSYVPRDVPFLLTMYDDDPWLVDRRGLFESRGVPTRVLWTKPRKGIVGADIRRRIAAGDEWRHLVPDATARVIVEHGIGERIRQAASASTTPEAAGG